MGIPVGNQVARLGHRLCPQGPDTALAEMTGGMCFGALAGGTFTGGHTFFTRADRVIRRRTGGEKGLRQATADMLEGQGILPYLPKGATNDICTQWVQPDPLR